MTASPTNCSTLRDLALVVLAAGKSTRMGSPKALVEFEGRPLLEHLLSPDLLRQLADVVVVLGHHADVLRPIVDRLGFRCVVNPDPDRGRTGSVQTGLRALVGRISNPSYAERRIGNPSHETGRIGNPSYKSGGSLRGVFVQPVDCPIVLPATFRSLAASLAATDLGSVPEVVVPSYRGRHGHPPLVSAATWPRILAAGPDEPLRELLQPSRFIEVDDPGVLVNVDRPEDLRQLAALRAARQAAGTQTGP